MKLVFPKVVKMVAERILSYPCPFWIALLISSTVGILYVANIFDFGFIVGTSSYWNFPGGDRAVAIMGSSYYVVDAWRFPLFYVKDFGYPDGTNIIFTDSIPFVALFFKFLYAVFGLKIVNYYGLWIAACFVLQGIAFTLILWYMGYKDIVTTILGSLLGIAVPALHFRFYHATLCAHFFLLLSLYFAIKIYKEPDRLKPYIQFGALVLLALWTHGYLFVMSSLIFMVVVVQGLISKKIPAVKTLIILSSVGLASWVMMFVGGHFTAGTLAPVDGGFGYYSMNMTSPFYHKRAMIKLFASTVTDATGGQGFEGGNYLGMGILFLILVHILFSRKAIQQEIKRQYLLAFLMLGFTMDSLSNTVYFGNHQILSYELPAIIEKLVNIFRSSGRFFWPVTYSLLVFCTLLTLRRFKKPVALSVLGICVIVQLVDMTRFRSELSYLSKEGTPESFSHKAMQALMESHEFINVYPTYDCVDVASNEAQESYIEALYPIAKSVKRTNASHASRGANKDCPAEIREANALDFQAKTLTLYLNTFFAQTKQNFENTLLLAKKQDQCRKFELGYVCTDSWAAVKDNSLIAEKFHVLSQVLQP
jgi:hypothetical protein